MKAVEQWVPHQRNTWPWRVGTLKREVQVQHGTLPVGTKIKIVMVSRFGDVGITTDFNADTGYVARVSLDDLEPEAA